jgi:transcriptional regulator with XRE-family HTH domain
MADSLINVAELGEYVKRQRQRLGLSLREVATTTGVSASTLSRVENGVGTPDSATLARLAQWLGIPLERLMSGSLIAASSDASAADPVVYFPTESTPNIVEAHLRADKNLRPETAKALAELFRVAYTQFSVGQK